MINGKNKRTLTTSRRIVPNCGVELWRADKVTAYTTLNMAHISRLERVGKFPCAVQLGVRTKGWIADEVRAWLSWRIAARGRVTPWQMGQ
ncbi:MAG: AlpA family phage regulatory protein [Mariprofundaceae bacterium]|nr:AlpA family phage regulatory protein [Mariprofundaceae bacterium]